jgi:hypothetical protein
MRLPPDIMHMMFIIMQMRKIYTLIGPLLMVSLYLSVQVFFFSPLQKKSLFPSKEPIKVIPEILRTLCIDTYIDGNTTAQSIDVMELFNEMHAYYLGTKCTLEILEAYKIAEKSDSTGFYDWV